MLTLFLLNYEAQAQSCEVVVETTLVCDGVGVPEGAPGVYDLAGVCDPVVWGTGDTGNTSVIVMDTSTSPVYVPDYAHGPYTTGINTMALLGQSLCKGPSPADPWWNDSDTGDTGAGAEPLVVGRRFEAGNSAVTGDEWGAARGPETGILTGRWSPELHVMKVCYGSSTMDDWLWTLDEMGRPPFLNRWAFNRADQFAEGPMRGYAVASCLIIGTTEAEEGNPNRQADIQEMWLRLQSRWAGTGENHLLMVPITGGDPAVSTLPYLADIEVADRAAAAANPHIVVLETADIYAEHLKSDGRHLTPRGAHLLGRRCADYMAASGLYTEVP